MVSTPFQQLNFVVTKVNTKLHSNTDKDRKQNAISNIPWTVLHTVTCEPNFHMQVYYTLTHPSLSLRSFILAVSNSTSRQHLFIKNTKIKSKKSIIKNKGIMEVQIQMNFNLNFIYYKVLQKLTNYLPSPTLHQSISAFL